MLLQIEKELNRVQLLLQLVMEEEEIVRVVKNV